MQPEGFTILLEDGPLLVVDKPGGLLTQAPPGIDSLETRVKRFLKARDEKPGKVYLAVTHRLIDPFRGRSFWPNMSGRPSGSGSSSRIGGSRRSTGRSSKGSSPRSRAPGPTICEKIPDQPRSEVVAHDRPEGKIAILNYRVLGRAPGRTWLEIELVTGRTHQIRVQASSRGTPILGDFFYGAASPFGPASDDERQRIIASMPGAPPSSIR